MKAEEIRKLGLREGDTVLVTVKSRIHGIDDGGDCVTIDLDHPDVIVYNTDISAIDLVMPKLPDGWEWHPTDRREVLWPEEGIHVFMHPNGDIACWKVARAGDEDGPVDEDQGSACLPSAVAKALIEYWEARS